MTFGQWTLGQWDTWPMGHLANGTPGQWDTWPMGHLANGALGQWGTWPMGHLANGQLADRHLEMDIWLIDIWHLGI
jgi:hypothetical protein